MQRRRGVEEELSRYCGNGDDDDDDERDLRPDNLISNSFKTRRPQQISLYRRAEYSLWAGVYRSAWH